VLLPAQPEGDFSLFIVGAQACYYLAKYLKVQFNAVQSDARWVGWQ